MPQVITEQLADETLLGLWKITESSAELEKMLELNPQEKELIAQFRNETRKMHWLSYRVLIRQMLGKQDVSVLYHESGKPYMDNLSGHISVTHSGCYSAIIYSNESSVGIDIERIQQRIEKVAHKYLSADELEQIDPGKRTQHLVTLWAAKEALYKLFGRTDVEFDENIRIETFVPASKGEFKGSIIHKDFQKVYLFHYFLIEDYVLVWVKE